MNCCILKTEWMQTLEESENRLPGSAAAVILSVPGTDRAGKSGWVQLLLRIAISDSSPWCSLCCTGSALCLVRTVRSSSSPPAPQSSKPSKAESFHWAMVGDCCGCWQRYKQITSSRFMAFSKKTPLLCIFIQYQLKSTQIFICLNSVIDTGLLCWFWQG